jgi:methyl-accepting chemotaxis protein
MPAMKLTISRRLGLLVALAILASLAIIVVQLLALRASLTQERQNAVRSEVQTAASIVKNFAAAAERGELTVSEAQERAKKVLRDIRYGNNDFFFVYLPDGNTIVLGTRPDLENKIRIDTTDANGVHYVRDLIAKAQGGGGFVSYQFPRAGSMDPADKLSYAMLLKDWNWIVVTGVYVDDLDAVIYAAARNALFWAVGLIALLCACAVPLARGLVRPVRAITSTMSDLADGKLDVAIPGIGRTDEIGAMAKAVAIFKANAVEREELQHQQKDAAVKSEAQRKVELRRFADQFESAVGGIIATVSSASTKLETAAQTLTRTADLTQKKSLAVNSASNDASRNVQAVAAATNEMTTSIGEISRQVQTSSRIATEAVRQAEKTNANVGELSLAASRIGDVVKLITAIAEQTNLLALNATIEAARAGDAGKGFAVVAQEVKALASQTSKATEEIVGQIQSMQATTQGSVAAIKEIGGTINQVAEIVAAIAAAVEEQSAATAEISRNIQQTSSSTAQVAENITEVSRGAEQTGTASGEVLSAVGQLATESNRLELEVGKFLSSVRAA